MSPPSIAVVCESLEWLTPGTMSGAGLSGITSPVLIWPVVAPSQRASWTQIWPRISSKESFSWKRMTTCVIGLATGRRPGAGLGPRLNGSAAADAGTRRTALAASPRTSRRGLVAELEAS